MISKLELSQKEILKIGFLSTLAHSNQFRYINELFQHHKANEFRVCIGNELEIFFGKSFIHYQSFSLKYEVMILPFLQHSHCAFHSILYLHQPRHILNSENYFKNA